MLVTIVGHDLPGRSCGPGPEGQTYENIHVGLKHRTGGVTEPQPGDADEVTWTFEVRVRAGDDGRPDFGGGYVYGSRGDRSVGLPWGEVDGDGGFHLFRGAKLRLDAVDPEIVDAANAPGRRLVGRVGLTDRCGHPRCASVRPPDIAWTAEPA
jgi:Family of unknown function (DUF5990)